MGNLLWSHDAKIIVYYFEHGFSDNGNYNPHCCNHIKVQEINFSIKKDRLTLWHSRKRSFLIATINQS